MLLCVTACCVACGGPAHEPRPSAPVVAAAATVKTPAAAEMPQPSAAAPSDDLVAVEGAELLARIKKSGDKATLVTAWASWCGACKKELPMLAALAPALHDEHVGLMFVSADVEKDRAAAAAMLQQLSPPQPGFIVRGSLGAFKRALDPTWKGALPSTFLFDAGAIERYFWPGPVYDYEVTPIIEQLLAGQPLEGPTHVEPGPAGE